MSWFGALVIFVLASWMVFFAIASVGVRTGADTGSPPMAPGCEVSAPVGVNMWKKALIAMAGGVIITLCVGVMIGMGVFSFLVSIARLQMV